MLLMASTIFAQTISVTVNGKAVTDGETVDCKFDEIEKKGPIPQIPTTWKMEPEVIVKSTQSQEVSVSIDVLEKKGDNQVQNCFVTCVTANAANNFVVTEAKNMTAGEEKNAQIHFSTKVNPEERPLERNVRVTVATDKESLSFTLHMFWDPDGTLAIGKVEMDSESAPAFTLSGVKQNEQSIPAGSIYIKKGKKFLKK